MSPPTSSVAASPPELIREKEFQNDIRIVSALPRPLEIDHPTELLFSSCDQCTAILEIKSASL